ncbi:MAG: endonuclease/exonuclease/phosphatase [Phycisphaera sp.]|nr:MAG: endonuclease/exonuclease/phosphatase [Phycisphaera sp.]
MPFYRDIKYSTPEGRRTVAGLFRLREQLATEVPERTMDETLLLATWNIRDFDKPAYGRRSDEAIQYIAEVISKFDIVAIQEVYKDLEALNRVMRLLGGQWDVIFTDTTEGNRGNDERMAFVFDTRKVSFKGLAGQLVLPPVEDEDGNIVNPDQIWRTPFIAGFQAGWCKFQLATVHILWGGGDAEPEDRINEIKQIAQFLKKRTLDEHVWSQNLILLGDFNIFNTDNETFAQFEKAGFTVPESLQELPSNWGKNRHYDQIAFRARPNHLDFTGRDGVFNFFDSVYRLEEESAYVKEMGPAYKKYTSGQKKGQPRSVKDKTKYFRTYWRTHQMSDHLVMWTELRIDYSEEYLGRRLAEG